jgi:hypothetical protein
MAIKKSITDITAIVHGARLSITCSLDGKVYRIDGDVEPLSLDDLVYVSPGPDLTSADRGFFRTRTMAGATGRGKRIRDVLAAAAPRVVPPAIERYRGEQAAQLAEHREQVRAAMVRDSADELLQSLRAMTALAGEFIAERERGAESSPSVLLPLYRQQHAEACALLAKLSTPASIW